MITELNDYQNQAVATMKTGMSLEEINKYCCMQLASEIGELSGMLAKHYVHGKKFDLDNFAEETGDIFWYLANITNANGFTLSQIATLNNEKLKKRHGEKYNQEYYS